MKRVILSAKLRLVAGILTGVFGVGTLLLAQEMSGLEIIRTLEHPNYSISALDCYFKNGQQLIAYSNASGGSGGDTLVIYGGCSNQ